MLLDALPDGWTPPLRLPGDEVHHVYVDPGHGEPRNSGNRDCFCVAEQDYTLSLATDVARRLEATGRFRVRIGRTGEALPAYVERIADAEAWGADALVSLHSDVRAPDTYTRSPEGCSRSTGATGFAVLWSDEGGLADARGRLAASVADAMIAGGFAPYDGAAYVGLYDPTAAGAFVDRHEPRKRIRMLRRPPMPSVIVETHQAWDVAEATRWRSPATREAFAEALAVGLAAAL
ncbi:MAG: N-acetylmuramoyl-L-alanine amidase family protein [Myxococcota bacterium]